jgi:hypothetical protein
MGDCCLGRRFFPSYGGYADDSRETSCFQTGGESCKSVEDDL